jgi:hypothetical protein
MNTPKYIGIVQSDPQWPQLIAHGDDKASVESEINKDVSQLKGRIGDIYIRERDTRRQFSPEDVRAISALLWANHGIDICSPRKANEAIEFILAKFRKLINQP